MALFSRSVERWLGSSFHFLSGFVRLEKCKCNRSFRNAISQQQIEQQRIADEQARLDTCRKALESLKEVNPKQADKLGNEFTALLSAASQYNSVRSKVAEPTKQGIDSMYQFKSIKLCADIEKELIDSLVKRGENVQL